MVTDRKLLPCASLVSLLPGTDPGQLPHLFRQEFEQVVGADDAGQAAAGVDYRHPADAAQAHLLDGLVDVVAVARGEKNDGDGRGQRAMPTGTLAPSNWSTTITSPT